MAQLGLLYPGSTANLTSRGVVTSADDLEVIRKSALTPRNKVNYFSIPADFQKKGESKLTFKFLE